jgi:hypothetical protein
MSDGQLAMNTNLASPGLFLKDSNGDLVKVGPVHVGTTAPNATPGAGGQAGNSKGELWLDTTGSDYTLKTWDGIAWREIVVTSTMIKDGTIVNADINASAAIAGTKISPDFGSQTVATTGVFSHALGAAATPSVTFTGDLNTGVFSPGADQVAISTNGTGRLFVDASGFISATDNIGIGGPAGTDRRFSADITGVVGMAVGFNDSGTTNAYGIADNCAYVGVAQAFPLAFSTTGQERLRIDSSGNVGIGTGAPAAPLHVVGEITSGAVGTNGTISLRRTSDGVSVNSIAYVSATDEMRLNNGSGSGNITFQTVSTERARIDSSGRVLIGTSNVTGIPATLNVIGGNNTVMHAQGANADSPFLFLSHARGTGVQSVNAQDGVGAVAFVGYDGTNALTAARIESFVDGTPGTNDMPGRLVFSVTADGASSPTEALRIINSGRHEIGSTQQGILCGVTSAAGTATAVFVAKHSITQGNVPGTGTDALIIWSNGDVVNVNNSYGSISDLKLKENIVDANSQWDDLKALQVRNYNFKEGQTHTQIGLIAQEVEQVSPGLVSETPDRDEDGNDLGTATKAVNYSVLYMKAVKALQEAMERIEALEADVAQLKGQ